MRCYRPMKLIRNFNETMDIFCTFVIPTRNDNYGNFSTEDFRLNLELLTKQLSGSSREFEIIVVQWNKVEGNPCLSDVIDPIDFDKNIHIRFISVPGLYHSKIMYSELKPFCFEAAVNVGIRRATGTFCCVKAQDGIYSDDLIRWLKEENFDEQKIYRALRIDHNFEGIEGLSDSVQKNTDVFKYLPYGKYYTNACGDFMLMSTKVWVKMRGWADSGRVVNTGYDGITLARAICHGLSQEILPEGCVVLKKIHSNIYRLRTNYEFNIFLSYLRRCYEWLGKPQLLLFLYKAAIFPKLLITGIIGFPRMTEKGVPVDNYGRYYLKFYFNLYFSKIFNGNSTEWGLPNAREIEIKKVTR